MLPNFRTVLLGTVTALSVALTTVAPAQALGRNERNFLKGVAATVIIGALINDAQARTRAPQPVPEPQYRPRPDYGHGRPDHGYRPRHDDRYPAGGRVIGSNNSVHATLAAQSFNSYTASQRRAIQSRLRAYGYYTGGIDGAFGPGTYRAVVAYARDSGGEQQLRSQAGAYGVYDSLIY